MTTQLEKDVESLKKDIERFRSDLSRTLSDVGNLSHDKVLETKDRLKSAMEGFEGMALQQAGHAHEVIHDQGEQAIQAFREGVVHRPFTSVAISFTAGLMAALLLERHRE